MKVTWEAHGTSPDGSLGRGGGRPRSRAATAAAAEVAASAAPNVVADAVTDAAVDAVGRDPPQTSPPKLPRRVAARAAADGRRGPPRARGSRPGGGSAVWAAAATAVAAESARPWRRAGAGARRRGGRGTSVRRGIATMHYQYVVIVAFILGAFGCFLAVTPVDCCVLLFRPSSPSSFSNPCSWINKMKSSAQTGVSL